MTREQFELALDLIDQWSKADEEFDDSFISFFEHVCPSNVLPVVEVPILSGVMDTLCKIYPEYKEHFEYYAYEIKCSHDLTGSIKITNRGKDTFKEYDFSNRNEYIDFIMHLCTKD